MFCLKQEAITQTSKKITSKPTFRVHYVPLGEDTTEELRYW